MYTITLGMLVALLLGLNMSWSAISVALTLIFLDFKDARVRAPRQARHPERCLRPP